MPIHERVTTVPNVAPGTGYVHAVTTSGHLAFVAGQVAVDSTGQLVGVGDLAAQTRQALHNMHNVLRALGAGWEDVARFTWYVVGDADIQPIRDIRDEFLRPALGDRPNPASTLVRVAGLARPEFLMEVDATVALPD